MSSCSMETRLEGAKSVLLRLVLKARIGGIRGVVGWDESAEAEEEVLLSPVALGEVSADWLATQSLVEFSVFNACSETFCVIMAGGGPDPRTSFRLCDAGTGWFLGFCGRMRAEKEDEGGDRGPPDRVRVRPWVLSGFEGGESSGGEDSGGGAALAAVGGRSSWGRVVVFVGETVSVSWL